VALVVRVGYRLEILFVAPRSADVLGRAPAACVDEPWIGDPGLGVGEALDVDLVLPAVAEVVEVLEGLGAGRADEIGKR
jgi:hypothetical protein